MSPRVVPAVVAAALLTSTAVGHIVYPVALSLRARRHPPRLVRPLTEYPAVTVLIPAYLEAGVIAEKIGSVRALGYPGELTVLVVADGDADTALVARQSGAEVLELTERHGKSQALNAGMRVVDTEYVVLTDANNRIRAGSLERLIDRISSRGVGAVAGEKLEGSGGELAYWRFSNRIKRGEAQLGSTLGLDGGLCAVRRSAWEPIPADISNDDYWIALDLIERGWVVDYEPEALVEEETIGSFSRSWERRTRVLGGSLWVAFRKRHLLNPARGLVAFELWGHKVWRSTLGPISHLVLIVLALRNRGPLSLLFLAGHLLGAWGFVQELRGRKAARIVRVAWMVLYLQTVAFGGMLRFIRGDRVLKWQKPAR